MIFLWTAIQYDIYYKLKWVCFLEKKGLLCHYQCCLLHQIQQSGKQINSISDNKIHNISLNCLFSLNMGFCDKGGPEWKDYFLVLYKHLWSMSLIFPSTFCNFINPSTSKIKGTDYKCGLSPFIKDNRYWAKSWLLFRCYQHIRDPTSTGPPFLAQKMHQFCAPVIFSSGFTFIYDFPEFSMLFPFYLLTMSCNINVRLLSSNMKLNAVENTSQQVTYLWFDRSASFENIPCY